MINLFKLFNKKSLDPAQGCARGRALVAKGRMNEALGVYDEVIAFYPKFAQAYAERGTAYATLKQPGKAIADLLLASRLGYTHGTLFMTLGTAYLEQGDFQNALTWLNKAESTSANNPLVYYNRARAHAELGDKAAAISDLNRCLGFGPDAKLLADIQNRLGALNGSA
jgi:tetratricopeptide (TPR) repeat protein